MAKASDIICLKGITIGGMVDIVGSVAMGIPLAVIAAIQVNLPAVPPSDQARVLGEAMQRPGYTFASLLLGSLFSVVGGYVAARIARRYEVLNGALSALPCMIFGLWGAINGMVPAPWWQHVLFFLLSPMLGAAGGRLWLRRASPSPST